MHKLFRKSETQLVVVVEVANGSKTLQIKSSATGQELLDQVAEEYNLDSSTSSLLGLRYTNSKGTDAWITSTKKITAHDIKKEDELNLKLCVKYYPTNFEKELKGETAKFIFCHHINAQIQSNDLYTPAAYYILLTSLSLQAESKENSHAYPGTCSPDDDHRLRSKVMTSQAETYNIPVEQLQQDVIDCWKLHRGKSREDASMDFLKIAKELDSYGITYFDLKTSKGTAIHLGVNNEGITIYEGGRKLTPKIGVVWNEISKITYNHTKLLIETISSKTETIKATALDLKMTTKILDLCIGNHSLYLNRQKLQNTLDSVDYEVANTSLKSKIESLMKLFPVDQSTRAEDKEFAENLHTGRNRAIMMNQARSESIEKRVLNFKSM